MTTTRPPVAAGLRVTLPRVVRAEVFKLRTTRSTWLTSLAAMVFLLGLSAIRVPRAETGADVLPDALAGSIFVMVIFGGFGAVIGAREFGTGLIRTSLAAVPRRGTLVAGKLVALLLVVVPVALVGIAASVFLADVIVPKGLPGVALSDPATLATIGAQTASIALAAALGLGLGVIMRSSAGGVATTIGVFMVLPILASLVLPASWSHIYDYLPSEAAASMTSVGQPTEGLSPATGAVVYVVWVLVSLAGAVLLMNRRDA